MVDTLNTSELTDIILKNDHFLLLDLLDDAIKKAQKSGAFTIRESYNIYKIMLHTHNIISKSQTMQKKVKKQRRKIKKLTKANFKLKEKECENNLKNIHNDVSKMVDKECTKKRRQ